MISTISY